MYKAAIIVVLYTSDLRKCEQGSGLKEHRISLTHTEAITGTAKHAESDLGFAV